MAMPQETSQKVRDENQSAALPSTTNTYNVFGLAAALHGLNVVDGKLADLEIKVAGSIVELRTMVTSIRAQIVAAAIEAGTRADGGAEITDMPVITERNDRGFQPGEMVPGKGIFIGEFDLADARGTSLGIRTRWYDTAIELGKLTTFNGTARVVANSNENGRGGLRLDPADYEAELFKKLKTGEAIGKNVIAPREVVKAIYQLRNSGEYKRMSDGNLPGKLITLASGTGLARWQWSCTPDRDDPDGVRAVDFTDGTDDWTHRDNHRLSGRACFAELAL